MTVNLTTTPLFQQITDVLAEKCDVPREDIRPETKLEDIELDSLALIEVALTLRKKLGVSIATEDLSGRGDGTVADLYELVRTASENA